MKDADKFRRIIFKSPQPRNSVFAIVLLGLLFGFVLTEFQVLVFHANSLLSLFLASIFFILPALFYGAVTNYFIENFFRRRAFLLSLLNEILLFVGLIPFAYSGSIFLFILGFTLSTNVLAMAGVSGRKGLVPLLFPLLYFLPPLLTLHFSEIFYLTIFRGVLFFSVGAATLFSIHLLEYYFHLSVEASGLEIFTTFLNEDMSSLPWGIEIEPLVQTLRFKNQNEDYVISMPWLHPGPLRNIGGGSMSSSLIEGLNEGPDEKVKGYFWHVPSSHEDDPSDSETVQRVLESSQSGEPTYNEKVTKILKKSGDSFEVYGQRFDDNYLVFLNVEGVDDFETSIFRNIREQTGKKIAFIDMHHHEPIEEGSILLGEEKKAESLSEGIFDLLEDLENEEEYQISAGLEVSDDRDFSALVEEVSDESYLFLTMDRNGLPKKMKKRLKGIREENNFDRTIFMTTDSHKSSKFLEKEKDFNLPPSGLIDRASDRLQKTEMGLLEKKLENVRVLGKNASSFEASVSFALHLFPVFLILVYFFLFLAVIW